MAPTRLTPSGAALAALLCLFPLIPVISINAQAQSEVAPLAKSDTFGVDEEGGKHRIQHSDLAPTNFRISGVDLTKDEGVLAQAARVFGATSTVARGDASTGNGQACYRSATNKDNTYLIFGRGEVDSSFILSSNSSAWTATEACKPSGKITNGIATEAGLHLGLTQKQVIAILGLATTHTEDIQNDMDELTYSLESRKMTDPQKLQEIERKSNLSREVLLENYEFYTIEVYIDAHFEKNSLTRLHVDWSAQY